MPSGSSFQRLWKYSLALIVIIMVELGMGIADIIIKCPICKEASYIPAACFALPVWTPVLLIGTCALGLMTGPESSNSIKLLRWCLVLSFISIAVSLVVIGWCVTNIVQSVSTGLLANIGMKSIALAALIIIVSLVEVCLFIALSLNCIDLIDRVSKKGDSEDGSGLTEGPADNKAARKKSKQKQWIFANNATLLNVPKQRAAAEESNVNNQHNDSSNLEIPTSLQRKRPTVMELMRTHFQTSKPLLLPAPSSELVASKELPSPRKEQSEPIAKPHNLNPAKSQVLIAKPQNLNLANLQDPIARPRNLNPVKSQDHLKSQKPKGPQLPKASAVGNDRRLSGKYDNAEPQKSPFERGNPGARNSFNAIKAFFDGNVHKNPGDTSSLPSKPKQTAADIHIISNNALMGNSNTRFSNRDGAFESSTVPKFTNMRLPTQGLPGSKMENARQPKVTFVSSFQKR